MPLAIRRFTFFPDIRAMLAVSLTSVITLSLLSLLSLPVSAAQVLSRTFNWNNVSLNSSGGFEQAISIDQIAPNFEWKIEIGIKSGSSETTALLLILRTSNSPKTGTFTTAINNVEEVAGNCSMTSPNFNGDKSKSQANCNSDSFDLIVSEKYFIKLEPVIGQPNWWQSSLRIGSNDRKIVGTKFRLAIADGAEITYRNVIMGYQLNDCSTSPKADATFFKPTNLISPMVPLYAGNLYGSCGNSSDLIPNAANSNFIKVSFGGAGSSNNNTPPPTVIPTTRIPRSLTDVPRPEDLLIGLTEVKYKGYFADDTSWFSNDRFNSSKISVGASPSSVFTSFDGSTNAGGEVSFSWTGYIIPDVSGSWSFKLTADDAAYLWIGNDAIRNYASSPDSALIKIPGIHASIVKQNSITLVKNQIYPVRIQYGNASQNNVAVFKWEYQAPDNPNWQTDFSSLLWRSPGAGYSDNCTNFGISYTLTAKLGYDRVDACKGAAKDPSNSVKADSKTFKPLTLSAVLNGRNLEVRVTVSLDSLLPEFLLLEIPSLDLPGNQRLKAKVVGDTAKWLIPLDPKLSLQSLGLSAVAVRNGEESEPLLSSFQLSELSRRQVPPAPKKVSYRIIGNDIIVSAQIENGSGIKAFLLSMEAGYTSNKPLRGEIQGNKAIYTFPVNAKWAGKILNSAVYVENNVGKSPQTSFQIQMPKQPRISLPTAKPIVPETILCKKGSQSRAFVSSKCPPGWNKI